MLGTPEILLIALVVLLLFGGKKIPELMRGMGKGVKSFKDGMNGKDEEPKREKKRQKEDFDPNIGADSRQIKEADFDHNIGGDIDVDL